MHRPDISITITTMDPDSGEQDDALTLAASFEGSVVIDIPPSQGDRVVLSFPLLSEEDQKPGEVMVSMDPLDLLSLLVSYFQTFEAYLAWKSISRTKGLHDLIKDLVDMLEPMMDRCSIRDQIIEVIETRTDGLEASVIEAIRQGEVALSPVVRKYPNGEMSTLDPLTGTLHALPSDTSPEAYLRGVAEQMHGPCTERQAFNILTSPGQIQAHIAEMMGETAES